MKIRTGFEYLAPDSERYWALDDDTYDGAEDSDNRNEIGTGPTEADAIAARSGQEREPHNYECTPL